MKKRLYIIPLCLILVTLGCSYEIKSDQAVISSSEWESVLDNQIKLLGHRNWIVVVDAAYPIQSNPGITTILSEKSHTETIKHVLTVIDKQKHVKPIVYLDKEIDFVDEISAKGITNFRKSLEATLSTTVPQKELHEKLIRMIDKAADQFNILIIKTEFSLPYTSVFFQLDCKYWNTESEQKLREKFTEE